MKLLLLLLTISYAFAARPVQVGSIYSGPIRVGNGDNGEDLQSFNPIKEGVIVETRGKAIKLLKSYNVHKIEGLGSLIPEVENTKLYMTKKGLTPAELAKLGAFNEDATGLIYARTMPRPYSPTRFFPAAMKLNEEQLVALHIHEALHRSLPDAIREDEQIASAITQSITEPNASFDSINGTVAKYMSSKSIQRESNNSESKIYVPKTSRLNNPSRLGLEFRIFEQDEDSQLATGKSFKSMYILSSHLYPFGKNEKAIGIGFDASVVQTQDESFMGPLSISGRYKLYTHREFDIEGFAQMNLNTLSEEELKDSLMGRDTTTVGITLATQRDYFFLENDFFHTFESEVDKKIGNIDYIYTFGGITGINLRAGHFYKGFMLGGFAEFLLSDNFIIDGEDFKEQTGRNRIVSWGPHIEYRKDQYSLIFKGRFLLDATQNASYDYLSDLMGYGVGQGSVQTQFNVFF